MTTTPRRTWRVPGVSRRQLKRDLALFTGCAIQHDGWCCGTCFPFEQKLWHAVLAFRGDYESPPYRTPTGYRLAISGDWHGDTYVHQFVDIPVDEIKRRIQRLACLVRTP